MWKMINYGVQRTQISSFTRWRKRNMIKIIKSIVKWVWKIVSWPFKKALEWMKSALPK
jgi:hypothetical protein